MSDKKQSMKALKNSWWKNRRGRQGSIATTITCLVIVATILLNIGANLLAEKTTLSFDLTKNKMFQLTQESIDYVKNLSKPVEIVVLGKEEDFAANGEYFVQANAVLKKYDQNSEQITLKYIDLTENPTYKDNFPEEELQTNNIIVKSGEQYTIVSPYDLFEVQTSYYGSQITASKAEQAMTSAILNVTSDEKVKISFISGFDEEDSSGFTELLKKNNYEVVTQNILTEDIDQSAEVVVIFAPKRDYDQDAIDKLNAYLDNNGAYGKDVVYIVSPNQGDAPNLQAFLQSVGLKVGDGMVFETDASKLLTMSSPFYTTVEYDDSTYSQSVKNTSIPVALPFCRPIEVSEDSNAAVLLRFSETAGIIPSNADENWAPAEEDIIGSIPAMAIASTSDDENASNIAVVGSMIGFDSTFLSKNSLNNSQYFLGVFQKLTDREDGVNIESKSSAGDELGANAQQVTALGISFGIALPLFVLVLGIIVWLRRRNK